MKKKRITKKTRSSKVTGAKKEISKKHTPKKDKFDAKLAFYLSLGFWIPLFNIGLAIVSIVIGWKALAKMRKDPRFGGRAYAIIALIISFSIAIGSIMFLAVYLSQKLTCDVLPTLF